jgi:D-3-phosphoglycerate dehydrogenase
MTTVAIVGTRYPDFAIEREVLAGFEIVAGTGGTADELVELAADADVILVGSSPRFTAEVLDRLSSRLIVRSGIGVDNIDLAAAGRLGYTVAYIPDYGTEAVAQHTLALALAANRRLVESDTIVRRGGWGFGDLRTMHLPSAMTAGVVGFGRIGRRVAQLLMAVGFGRILAHDAFVTPDVAGITGVTLDELLTSSDLITLHAPGPNDGSPLLGEHQISLMRPGSIVVNTARGSLIDVAAIVAGLKAGAPQVAALDVFEPEPPDLTPFRDVIDRMILSPHSAWYTEESQVDLRRKSAEEALRMLAGQAPLNAAVRPQEDP